MKSTDKLTTSKATSRTHIMPRKQSISTREYQARLDGQPDTSLQELTTDGSIPPKELAQQESSSALLPISISTYVASLTNAMISARYALQLELAVGLSVFYERGAADREAKKTLYSIYHKAGWRCDTPEAESYKTVNRRINATAALWGALGAERVGEMMGANAEVQLINALVKGLEPLQLSSVDAVLSYCGKPRIAAKPRVLPTQVTVEQEKGARGMTAADYVKTLEEGEVLVQPAQQIETKKPETLEPGEILLGESPASHAEKELPDDVQGPRWMRRLDDSFIHVDTGSIHISLPKEAPRSEVIAAAMRLLEYAEGMNGAPAKEVVREVEGALQAELKKLHKTEQEIDDEALLAAELRKVPEPMRQKGKRITR